MLESRVRLQAGRNATQTRGFHSRSKSLMALFLLFSLLFATLAALLTAFIDPLQFYHQPSWYTPLLSEEERYQNPGLAKNFDYDNIIIGTSMTQNFLPSQVSGQIGGTTLKLSMEGSTVDEHYQIARLALKTGKVKQVIWGLDYFSLKLETSDASGEFPDYLYDGKLWTDYKYWFNASVYWQFALSVKSMLTGTPGKDLEHLNNWNDEVVFGKRHVAKSYLAVSDSEQYFGLNEESTGQLQENFSTYILPLLKEYPDVKFYFYYPPYSVMRQVAWYAGNPVRFSNQLMMRAWMYEQFRQLDNVTLYDFQSEQEWTFNLDLYKDLSHHSGEVNGWIAEAIGRQDAKYLVTGDNVNTLNEKLEAQAASAVIDGSGNVYQGSVEVNGNPVSFTSRLIQGNGQLWLSAKEIAAALGAEVEWDAAGKTVTVDSGGHSIVMTIGSSKALVDGTEFALEAAPLLAGGKALIPLAFTAEKLGWEAGCQQENGWIRYTLTSE
ncbi:copper amine oxidase N-terminal domain-containing protein [Paenibacillus sp. S150]|uniref:copper amine oxidase N-terminal domain-containing protein n=1 Tax=Paenibacillus sp. S150 TaxID=2749826 RepID=UPI001C570D73|nr:copper amine oxidase N-terminal domain-containing protein [Paenibacillus sp. S150]MBW4082897.1 copper amine oxidase N-terminal domain-containing protein [Paenibacillus sp. S150]